ncbi:hypothetical protein CAPTEDRAFT_223847 [Capitella teleta]|uniref:N-terminal kinase-like protein n=1 Tax=Capitella teleta TaxID=283909 RepID=R7TWF0_CAPTE|nr:hypothetical protein CAPTEDRAFT_223847 [Capitella teleta]|eukprot:ELT98079.1 hypothetical protein CAPTEDRAFT_223847 [Capitella teleta]
MWSFFSRDPAKDFAYEIGEKIEGLDGKSLWSLHEGKHKTTGALVSADVAKTSFKKIKTLRHPNILPYIDGLESDKVLYLATEPVQPLETYLKNNKDNSQQNELAISWGLHQMAKGLSFLVNDCSLIHNNVCLASIFVDRAGEWKLGGVDYMYAASGAPPPSKGLPFLEKYDPPEKAGGGRKPTEKWSTDMWGMGCLIWEVFNGTLIQISALKSPGKIAKSLIPRYCELVGANPKSRPNPAKFIELCRERGGFFNNRFVQTMLFLEEIQIKEPSEKTTFFNSLSNVLDTFPESFCKEKILPQLIHAFDYGNAGSAVLMPMFKLGKLLDTEDYQTRIVPCVVKLFSSTDRATRVKLLQQIEIFVEYLTPAVVNEKIYPNIVSGFMDTNPVVRESTIKSMLHLACKLNYKNLNEELLKHFARLQAKDDQGGIRTNTTVCLGKIACFLNPQVRQKCLSSAYLRAIKDPFPPARQAGILAMAATHQFFTLHESSIRLLPALCGLTLDPDKGVRDQAFKAIKCFLGKLEKVSEDPALLAEMERDVNIGGSEASSASGWAGWAVSGMTSLTSKLYRGKTPPAPGATATAPSKPTPGLLLFAGSTAKNPSAQPANTTAHPERTVIEASPVKETEEQRGWDEANEGWDDDDNEDWGNLEVRCDPLLPGTDFYPPQETPDDSSTPLDNQPPSSNPGGWDDTEDHWGALEEDTSQPSAIIQNDSTSPWGLADFSPVEDTKSAASYNWGEESSENTGDFFSQMLASDSKKKKKAQLSAEHTSRPVSKPSTKKELSQPKAVETSKAWDSSGWDSDKWLDNPLEASLSKEEELKKKRELRRIQMEEKRAARQAAGGKGAMKLGRKLVD